MIKFYFSTLIRSLWRNRLFTVLNVFGLAVAICASWIIFRLVAMEHSYDKGVPDSDRTYQLVIQTEAGGAARGFAGVARGLLSELKNTITGLDIVAPMYFQYNQSATVVDKQGLKKDIEPSNKQISTFQDYFDLLNYHWLAGDRQNALADINSIVLTQKRAALYFPGNSPDEVVGKTITFNDTTLRRVTGVIAELPYLNSFDADEFIAISQQDISSNVWSGYSSSDQLYVKLNKGVQPGEVLSQINAINASRNKEDFVKYNFKNWYHLLPLSEKHFATDYGANTRVANKNVLNGLILIAGFILLLGCINYINLSTALLPQRSKELGIRKTLGGSSRQLIAGFVCETAMIVSIAILLSFVLSYLVRGIIKDFLPESYAAYINIPLFVTFLAALLVIITLIAGYYPAWAITKIDTVNVLKGQINSASGGKKTIRKSLIVFQFAIAQFFIICAVVIGQQLHYAMHKDFGFDKEAVVTIEIPYKVKVKDEYKEKYIPLKNVLLTTAGISGVSVGDLPMNNSMMSHMLKLTTDTSNAANVQVHIKSGDSDYVHLYDIHLLAGRNIRTADSGRGYLVNETALSSLGLKNPDEAVGLYLTDPDATQNFQIVGVIRDFHQFGVRSKIEPLAVRPIKDYVSNISIKLSAGTGWAQTLKKIENTWKEFYPGIEFKYKFYDDVIEGLYKQEEQTAALVKLATYISIFISCLGLFGLATLTAFQRTKEIGIRKVLGASLSGVVGLLSKEYIKLIFVSILLAAPLAWWVMNKWLEDFTFRIQIEWWMFLISGTILLLIAFITVSYQSIKAAVANPVKALRNE